MNNEWLSYITGAFLPAMAWHITTKAFWYMVIYGGYTTIHVIFASSDYYTEGLFAEQVDLS